VLRQFQWWLIRDFLGIKQAGTIPINRPVFRDARQLVSDLGWPDLETGQRKFEAYQLQLLVSVQTERHHFIRTLGYIELK
jgi:hypothetical protein